MNEQECGRLLTVVKTLDARMPEPDQHGFVRRLWLSMLDGVPLQAAQEAVHAWYRSERYRETRETIAPADIVGWWRDRRRAPVIERQAPPDPALIRDGVDRCVAALVARRAVAAGEDRETAVAVAEGEAGARRAYRARPCGHCGAGVGARCVSHRGVELARSAAHPSRMEAAEVVAGRGTGVAAVAELATVDPAGVFHD